MTIVNKKGLSERTLILGLVIGIVILVAVIFIIFGKGFSPATKTIDVENLKIRMASCATAGARMNLEAKPYKDCDYDDYPDSCDPCLGGDVRAGADENADSIQDPCEPAGKSLSAKENTQKSLCIEINPNGWNAATEQCLLKSYNGNCGAIVHK